MGEGSQFFFQPPGRLRLVCRASLSGSSAEPVHTVVMDVSSSGSAVTIAIPDYHARTESLRQRLMVQKINGRRAGMTRHKLAQLFLLVCDQSQVFCYPWPRKSCTGIDMNFPLVQRLLPLLPLQPPVSLCLASSSGFLRTLYCATAPSS